MVFRTTGKDTNAFPVNSVQLTKWWELRFSGRPLTPNSALIFIFILTWPAVLHFPLITEDGSCIATETFEFSQAFSASVTFITATLVSPSHAGLFV